MEGIPNPDVTIETVEGYARYAGFAYSRERLHELLPSLRDLMSQVQSLWQVEVGAAEMAIVLPSKEGQP